MRQIKPDSTEQFPAIPRPRPLTAGDTGKRLSPPLRPGYLDVRRRGPTGKFVGWRRVVAIWRQCLLNTTGVSPESPLSHTAESVKAEVMRLAPAVRARQLGPLIDSLDRDEEIEGAWGKVALQREGEIESGSVTGLPLEDVVARLEARFPG